MDSRTRAPLPSADAVEFVRFCHRRRRVGWPELYDEMCAVANRGLFRGWGIDELNAEGIGFSLFEMPALAALVGRIVAEEEERRSVARVSVAGGAATSVGSRAAEEGPGDRHAERQADRHADRHADRRIEGSEPAPALRLARVPAGA